MKKNYQKPAMLVVKMQHRGIICTSTRKINALGSNAGLNYAGASIDDDEDHDHEIIR